MKHYIVFVFSLISLGWSTTAQASLEIHCPSDKEITYSQYQAGNYYDKPVVYGAHTKYGPWIYPHLKCGSGYVDVKWEIVDHYARSYYCTQTIWVNNSSANSGISVWCPNELTIYCDQVDNFYYPKPEVTGSNYWIYGPWVSKSLNDCGVGSIWVEWKVVDGCGKNYYCKSAIWVKPRPGYVKIYWPRDFEADLCKDNIDPKYLPYPYGYPDLYQKNPCAKYGFSYKDEEYTFPNDPGICKKIIRRWTVIDWCTYNLNGYGHSSGKWEYAQLIKIVSKAKPTISCTPEVKINQEAYGNFAWVDIPIPSITSTCNGLSKLTHNSIYATHSGPDASGNYPTGTTYVIFKVTDPCGNMAVCTTKVIVLDKTLPTPYCIGSLVTSIAWHADGIYTIIDPKKFDVGSFDNKTPKEKLKFTAIPNKFTCDSLGTRKLRIWVEDEAGNKDYCTVTLILQDNKGMCPPPPLPTHQDTLTISGLLINPGLNPLDSVQLKVTSSQISLSLLASGHYITPKLQAGQDYKIIPTKKSQFLQGVTVADYTLLLDHLQGKDTLTDPYQLLAADIDLNDTIDMNDAFLLGYYILIYSNGTKDTLTSWRFIPADYNVNLINPLSNSLKNVPDFLQYSDLDTVIDDADFIGVKIGDLTGDILLNSSSIESLTQLKAQLQMMQQSRNKTFHQALTKPSLSMENPQQQFSKPASLTVFPNPFYQQTTLQLESQEAEKAILQVVDIHGKSVSHQTYWLNKGMNQLKIEGDVLRQQGIYFYQLHTSTGIFNGKFSYLK